MRITQVASQSTEDKATDLLADLRTSKLGKILESVTDWTVDTSTDLLAELRTNTPSEIIESVADWVALPLLVLGIVLLILGGIRFLVVTLTGRRTAKSRSPIFSGVIVLLLSALAYWIR